ncbi:hypothetical protein H696_02509 [Fonticula alba]|uniref:ABC transporter domain-containing protein n=1 Tax=Fonticula alba TaxID=691883 RepID=A0A058ZAZ4_FONAL|nr:hypothetical protein H696_02509 [Fonticula alba]KCV71569.1 hypothetical protein H696_02509 [Fonticula alba]|eukprot:XP_009494692.1 hypothetical protein H696_02509 [Fonticula alba]
MVESMEMSPMSGRTAASSAATMPMAAGSPPLGGGTSPPRRVQHSAGAIRRSQLNALFRKTATHQRYQMFTNICCVLACPLVLVAICGILAIVIDLLVGDLFQAVGVQYCSGSPEVMIPGTYRSYLPKADLSNGAVGVDPDGELRVLLGHGKSSSYEGRACMHFFSTHVYGTQMSDPFSGPVTPSCRGAPRAEFCPFPAFTPFPPTELDWFPDPPVGNEDFPSLAFRYFVSDNDRTWGYLATNIPTTLDVGGGITVPGVGALPPLTSPISREMIPTNPLEPRDVNEGIEQGLLGELPRGFTIVPDAAEQYIADPASPLSAPDNPLLLRYPYFEQLTPASSATEDLLAAVDKETFDRVQAAIKHLQAQHLLLSLPHVSTPGLMEQTLEAQIALAAVPRASMTLHSMSAGVDPTHRSDPTSSLLNVTFHVGFDQQLQGLSELAPTRGLSTFLKDQPGVAPLPSALFSLLRAQTGLTQALISLRSRAAGFLQFDLGQALRQWPSNGTSGFFFNTRALFGNALYPFGISFLLPVFVVSLVRDKEQRVLIMMRMNGLSDSYYYAMEYLHFYVLYTISTVVFIVTGVAFGLEFFTRTGAGVYLALFFLWGHILVAMALFLSALFMRARTAQIVTFLVVLLSIIVNNGLTFMFTGQDRPAGINIFPPFAFYGALITINNQASDLSLRAYAVADLVPGDPVFTSLMFMLAEIIVLLLVSFYLILVLPSEFGLQLPWHFPASRTYAAIQRFIARRRRAGNDSISHYMSDAEDLADDQDHFDQGPASADEFLHAADAVAGDTTTGPMRWDIPGEVGDAAVQQERRRIYTGRHSPNSPLVLRGVKKDFAGGKRAVRSVSFSPERDQIFGLLGPNGAGKTTLISLVTGLRPPSGGRIRVAGHLLSSGTLDSIYRSIGVCPQYDILWNDLPVEDHLYFYVRLKGSSLHLPRSKRAAADRQAVSELLAAVGLERYRFTAAGSLSGGERRRLSIAIALAGDPEVIFLDEPTTGLDPEVRRLIWTIIQAQRVGRTMVLTTHSMEEAEVLCQNIGIMVRGSLRVIGTPLELKSRYGSGVRMSVSVVPGRAAEAASFVCSLIPRECDPRVIEPAGIEDIADLKTISTNRLSIEFTAKLGLIARLFENLGGSKHGLTPAEMSQQLAQRHGVVDWGISQTSLEEVFLTIVGDEGAAAD